MNAPLYQILIDDLLQKIDSGQLSPGEKLPSVRRMCDSRGISKSTVLTAYRHLEAEGLIEAIPRSGYVVQAKYTNKQQALAKKSGLINKPTLVRSDQFVLSLMEKGAAFDLLPSKNQEEDNLDLRRCLSRAFRGQNSKQQSYYDTPHGLAALRVEISRHHNHQACFLEPEELTITNGCQNALLIALMATTKPGDIVAVESPCFYGAIQLIQTLGLQIVEIPSIPGVGIDIDTAKRVFSKWKVRALMISPNFATPTGTLYSEALKLEVLSLCGQHDTKIIEDDIYGDLSFSKVRPRTLYSYDKHNHVILCSSFSKSLSRDLRIGWIAAKSEIETIRRLKIATSLAVSQSLQEGLVDYMKSGLFDRYIKKKRSHLASQFSELQDLLERYFPNGAIWTPPRGGLSIWLELPEEVDTAKLYTIALSKGIVVTPGTLFTSKKFFNNFLRVSFAHKWIPERKRALKKLSEIINNETVFQSA